MSTTQIVSRETPASEGNSAKSVLHLKPNHHRSSESERDTPVMMQAGMPRMMKRQAMVTCAGEPQ
jgi:hypothetical protein